MDTSKHLYLTLSENQKPSEMPNAAKKNAAQAILDSSPPLPGDYVCYCGKFYLNFDQSTRLLANACVLSCSSYYKEKKLASLTTYCLEPSTFKALQSASKWQQSSFFAHALLPDRKILFFNDFYHRQQRKQHNIFSPWLAKNSSKFHCTSCPSTLHAS